MDRRTFLKTTTALVVLPAVPTMPEAIRPIVSVVKKTKTHLVFYPGMMASLFKVNGKELRDCSDEELATAGFEVHYT